MYNALRGSYNGASIQSSRVSFCEEMLERCQ